MSDFFDKLYDFENQTMQAIFFNMIKWFEFDSIDVECKRRPDVESTVWISITIQKGEKTWYIDGQRNDIVKRRLVEWLNKNVENPNKKQN